MRNLKLNRLGLFTLVVVFGLMTAIGCSSGGGGGGGGDSWCPGTICTNCATNCPDLDCPAGQIETCVGGAFFDADPNLRCVFCD